MTTVTISRHDTLVPARIRYVVEFRNIHENDAFTPCGFFPTLSDAHIFRDALEADGLPGYEFRVEPFAA